jgi:hypothetical protein
MSCHLELLTRRDAAAVFTSSGKITVWQNVQVCRTHCTITMQNLESTSTATCSRTYCITSALPLYFEYRRWDLRCTSVIQWRKKYVK